MSHVALPHPTRLGLQYSRVLGFGFAQRRRRRRQRQRQAAVYYIHMHALSISSENWVGLESNPEVLTDYAHKMGVSKCALPAAQSNNALLCADLLLRTLDRSWGFTDVFGLDEESLKMVPSPCVGIIFLYPFSQVEMRKKKLGKSNGQKTEGVWYMNQVIGNACGAVALMHTVMNTLDTVSSDSKFLKKFSADAKDADSRNRGKLFGSALRELHDEVSGRGQTEAPKPNADLDFHFVSLVAVSARARCHRHVFLGPLQLRSNSASAPCSARAELYALVAPAPPRVDTTPPHPFAGQRALI